MSAPLKNPDNLVVLFTIAPVRPLTIGEMEQPDSWLSDYTLSEIGHMLHDGAFDEDGEQATDIYVPCAGSLYHIELA